MSHANVRGEPTACQLYLDDILNTILEEKGIRPDAAERDKVSLAAIMFHCLKKKPSNEYMTNAVSGEVVSNDQILKYSVSIARSLITRGVNGKTVLIMMRNHHRMTAVYYGVLFANVIPFITDPSGTTFEIAYFLKLIEPSVVFCDREQYDSVMEALQSTPEVTTNVVVAEEEPLLRQFMDGHSEDYDNFQVVDSSPEDTVMLLPTSGSTGMPKAALLTNKGLVMQVPWNWPYHTQFPEPTKKVMLLTTPQWATFTMLVTACVVYEVPLVMTNKKVTPEHVAEILIKYKPSWTFFGPPFAKLLLPHVTAEHFSAIETMILLGAPASTELMNALKDKLPPRAHLCDGYGMTETHGFVAIPDRDAPLNSNGRVFTIMHYKLVDEDGNKVGLNQNGELYVKGDCVIKGYYKNAVSYDDMFSPDGWYRSGDEFHIDENERLSYVKRIKFTFKYQACHVSPEEVERVVCSVPGVTECVVVGTEAGPAAAVILRADSSVTREHIHKAVDASLSDHKRLRGGIVFVDSLPHTHSGKLKRSDCATIINNHIASGQCF